MHVRVTHFFWGRAAIGLTDLTQFEILVCLTERRAGGVEPRVESNACSAPVAHHPGCGLANAFLPTKRSGSNNSSAAKSGKDKSVSRGGGITTVHRNYHFHGKHNSEVKTYKDSLVVLWGQRGNDDGGAWGFHGVSIVPMWPEDEGRKELEIAPLCAVVPTVLQQQSYREYWLAGGLTRPEVLACP